MMLEALMACGYGITMHTLDNHGDHDPMLTSMRPLAPSHHCDSRIATSMAAIS